MKNAILILALIFISTAIFSQDLKPIPQKLNDLRSRNVSFASESVFRISPSMQQINEKLSTVVKDATILELDKNEIRSILNLKPENILFFIPLGNNSGISLELFKADIFSPDFTVVTATGNGRAVSYSPGMHYQGIIRGNNNSIAAVSIFNDEVMAIISNEDGNMVLGKIKNDDRDSHIIYNDKNIKKGFTSECNTKNDNGNYSDEELRIPSRVSFQNCIRLYWETNVDIFHDKGSVTNVSNYMTGLFNETSVIYANDNIPVGLSQLFVWDTISPYTATTITSLLDQFQSYRNSFNGDLGHLFGYSGGGGVAAGFNGLCNSNLDYSQCYSGIQGTYNNVPVYSWSVNVTTHEQGHLMGSRHTHACVWNGNNTAIDGCGPTAGYPYEGTCGGATLPPSGGTIMSYCHLTGSGVNFSNGFGSQPAAVIINKYNSATCLTSCAGLACTAPASTTTLSVGTTTATFTWPADTGASGFNIRYRIVGTSTWILDSTLTNSYNATGLLPGNNYEWQVQTICQSFTSIFTFENDFTTIPLSCDPPSNTQTQNVFTSTARFKWDAFGGATAYVIQYRLVGAGTWSIDTITTTNYVVTGLIPNSNYEWQVQTLCTGGGISVFSNSILFTTLVPGQAITITLQPDGNCGKDATIASCVPCGYSNTNFGDSPEFDAVAWTNNGPSNSRSLLQFDLSFIPEGSEIQDAKLSLYYNPTSSNIGHSTLTGPNDAVLCRITSPWDEVTVTWANQPGTDTVNSVLLPASTSTTQDYLNIDVKNMIQGFVDNPNSDFGFMFKLNTETQYRSLIFASSDHTNNALHPKLEITFAPSISDCIELHYASCYGIDALIGSCQQCGYDIMNFGGSIENDATAWTNGGHESNARSLIYWDLSSLPTNTNVTSAKLSLYTFTSPSNGEHSQISGDNDAYLSKILSPWDEYTVTWATMPTASPTDHVYLAPSINTAQDYLDIDVTALVQDMISNPLTNFGLMLQLVTESHFRKLIFASSDHGDPGKHPRLDICYSLPTKINSIKEENIFSVTYNLSSSAITLKSREIMGVGDSFIIYNTAGQCLRKFSNLNGNEYTFSIPGIADGIYIYQFIKEDKVLSGKLIIY